MAALRHAIFFGLDQVVQRIEPVAVDDEGTHKIVRAVAGRCEVSKDALEDGRAAVLRVQHALDVLHDEDGWAEQLDDPEVFGVEKMAFVALECLRIHRTKSGTACERIGLAWRTTDKYPLVCVAHGLANPAVDRLMWRFAEFSAARFKQRLPTLLRDSRVGEELFAGNLSADVFVVAVGDFAVGKRPEQSAQRQGLVGDLVFFNGYPDLEATLAFAISQRRKPLAKPSGPGEQVNHRNRGALRHGLAAIVPGTARSKADRRRCR